MRTVTRWKPAALGVTALLALAMLSGCVPAATHTSTPTPEATPLFATDDEALAAATKAYAAYLKMSDTIAHDGGAHPERIKAVAMAAALSESLKGFAEYRDAKAHSQGLRSFDSLQLQSIQSEAVTFYVCDDVSKVDVLDDSGASLVSPSRNPRTPFLVTASSKSASSLLISSRAVWEGKNLCG
ncbi:hypothetical protein [Leifsonia sp. Root112D2]|uniref:hypothetical protein n=1 Tax=Leifsonia sp. Root112D2 TaxID=1736426 RepID=UPI0012FA823B|nr:hypothetical protein [Leifsonia sp. Root112D2]